MNEKELVEWATPRMANEVEIRIVKRFLRWTAEEGRSALDLSPAMLADYRQAMVARGCRPAGTAPSLSVVRKLWRLLSEAGMTEQAPTPRRTRPAGWELVIRCAREMKAEGRSRQGIGGMRARVASYLRYLEDRGIDVRQADHQEVLGWQERLLAAHKRNSVATALGGVKMWCDYLVKWHLIPANPVDQVRRVGGQRLIPRDLPKEEEMEAYLCALSHWEHRPRLGDQKYQYRAHVMAELQYATGMRLDEMAQLEEGDIDWDRGLVTIRFGKGGRQRRAYLNAYALEVLGLWQQMRPWVLRRCDAEKPVLFGSKRGLDHAYNGMLNLVAREQGMGGWTSHRFRHALGYHLLRAGCKLRHIQGILGHERMRSTEVYTKVDEADTRAVLDACHPRGEA